MAKYDINLEFKYRKLTRPLLAQLVGTHISEGGDELIVRCLKATWTAYDAVEKYKAKGIKITIVARDPNPDETE